MKTELLKFNKRLLRIASDLTLLGVEVVLTWNVREKKWIMEVIDKNGHHN